MNSEEQHFSHIPCYKKMLENSSFTRSNCMISLHQTNVQWTSGKMEK